MTPANTHAPPGQRTAPACTLFLFGAHGDLVRRLLIPALYKLTRQGILDGGLRIVGVDHNPSSDDDFRQRLRASLEQQSPASNAEGGSLNLDAWPAFSHRIHYLCADFLQAEAYQKLSRMLAQQNQLNAVFYLATSPRFFGAIATGLGDAGLLAQTQAYFRRLVVEKPFGYDLASARELNRCLLQLLDETQIYRIDHYVGKDAVQNILVSRFANGWFEAFWNRHYIDHVQITATETLGMEGRGKFYDRTGALRDMVPNHLFQLLAIAAMEPPASFDADSLRNEKTKVLRAIRSLDRQQAAAQSVRGQYQAGPDSRAPGYRAEADVPADSSTETFVALKLHIDTWRWAGVPFYVRTGKRLSRRVSEIALALRPSPYAGQGSTPFGTAHTGYLTIRIEPQPGIWLDFAARRPGQTLALADVSMRYLPEEFFTATPSSGYETLLYHCFIGDQALFQRADTLEAAWQAVAPFQQAWQHNAAPPLPYAIGSHGPDAAHQLLAADGRSWHASS